MSFEPAQGQILLASSQMADPNFARTIILLVRFDGDGALGLVLNRPLEMTVKDACEKVLEVPCHTEGHLHQGGPCEGPLMVLHTRTEASEIEVVPGVHFTTDREQIEWLIENDGDASKFFVGYSGWTMGQLEAEIELGSWIRASADPARVFDDSEEQWTRLMTELTFGRYINPKQIPDDPSMN